MLNAGMPNAGISRMRSTKLKMVRAADPIYSDIWHSGIQH
jgi:hypothetical protein